MCEPAAPTARRPKSVGTGKKVIAGIVIALVGALAAQTRARQTPQSPLGAGAAERLPIMHPLLMSAPAWQIANPLFHPVRDEWERRPENQFAAMSERGVGDRRETWLATLAGVKVVDRRTGQMRHYTRRDGLPSDSVTAIVADRDGVWCVTAGGSSASTGEANATLCAFDAATNRWRTIQTVSKEAMFGRDWQQSEETRALQSQARPLLATSRRFVALTSGAVSYHTEAVLRLIDKKSGAVTQIPWDPALRADNNLLGPLTLSFADEHDLLLGTNLGLLRWNLKEHRWHRYLPDESVVAFATADRDTVWAVGQHREHYWSGHRSDQPVWTLARISLEKGQIGKWAPPDNGRAVDPRRDSFFGSDQENLRTALPVAVSIALDGSVWTSHVSRMELDGSMYSRVESHGFSGMHGGFERFEPKSAAWSAYPIRIVGKSQTGTVVIGGTGDEGAMPIADVPQAAVTSLALTTMPFSLYGYSRSNANLFYVRERCPEWICLDAP